mmetsp:Transcript_11611/g.24503  ORF Transcript_11611/g.24503 Transcript_11611/m.24503 type:complete len:227 (+) Transcript_11611:1046-1726(+)
MARAWQLETSGKVADEPPRPLLPPGLGCGPVVMVMNPGACKKGTIAQSPSKVAIPSWMLRLEKDRPPITGSFMVVHSLTGSEKSSIAIAISIAAPPLLLSTAAPFASLLSVVLVVLVLVPSLLHPYAEMDRIFRSTVPSTPSPQTPIEYRSLSVASSGQYSLLSWQVTTASPVPASHMSVNASKGSLICWNSCSCSCSSAPPSVSRSPSPSVPAPLARNAMSVLNP